ncbi:MAG: hypothetical protein KF756_13825 [Acidobacteria bacterium]|nr:hypothetical protein [Acidobacteriota bacterium]
MNTNKPENEKGAARELRLFVQGEGLAEIQVVNIDSESTAVELIKMVAAKVGGEFAAADTAGGFVVTFENEDKEISQKDSLKKAGIHDRSRVHIHRCRKVKVTVNFNGETEVDNFPPSTMVGKVKKWADKKFDIDKIDATEHALQLCGTATRPDEDTHIGALTKNPSCSVCFDLVPKRRVEGGV